MIEAALKHSVKPVVAFSGGKDSTVVAHIVQQLKPDIPLIWCNHGVAYKETKEYCRSMEHIVELTPETTFWKCVDKYGLPQSKSVRGKSGVNRCCYHLKEKPMMKYIKENNIDLVFTGLTASESRQRWMFFKHYGPYYYMKGWNTWKCHPIYDWTVEEVWTYIHDNNLPYNPRYDMNAERIGCVPCTAYKDWKKQLWKENPKMLKVILRKQNELVFNKLCGE